METFQKRVDSVRLPLRLAAGWMLVPLIPGVLGCDQGEAPSAQVVPASGHAETRTHDSIDDVDAPVVEGRHVSFLPGGLPSVPEMASSLDEAHESSDQPGIEPPFALDDPESEEMDFFKAPHVNLAPQQVIEATADSAPLRLIGFVSGGAAERSDKAIMKVGDKMVTLAVGESAEGVEVLEIEGRTVTIQRDRERRSLGLFEQPVVNAAVVRQSLRSRTVSRSSVGHGMPRSNNRFRPAARELPPLPLSPDRVPFDAFDPGQVLEQVGGIGQFELPELPELPEMPEINLPGFDLP